MRYAQIRTMDVSNGKNVGVALFVQGCPFHCFNCFNQETWDFSGGQDWNDDTKNRFLKLVDRDFIRRVSILGGEPLCDENVPYIFDLVRKIKTSFPDKKIWVYTGYTFEELSESENEFHDEILPYIDYLVDGRYIDALKDYRLKFRGSFNQRIIDVQQTLQEGEVKLWTTTS